MLIRTIHRYAAVFFAPAILFFCLTGLLQTFDLHKVRPDQNPPELVLRLAALHKDQTLDLPKRKPALPGNEAKRNQAPPQPRLGQMLLKVFVALTSVGLAVTTIVGLCIAFRGPRGRLMSLWLLLLGLVLPLVLMGL
ncbi:hypothetical protein [Phenylobacterium sp.]|jgi:hypothetical protein|uniref:hypothetical protein n=1 Tax=Phenylobacterium sp. TaxID=1871053 RepID=UPI002E37DE42|nr:hypothetical protein [Phenylobacterium sp.]HEX4711576.1 hypothetical protein [Phenylobacterium sp.]